MIYKSSKKTSWGKKTVVLTKGSYTRYREKTATMLLLQAGSWRATAGNLLHRQKQAMWVKESL